LALCSFTRCMHMRNYTEGSKVHGYYTEEDMEWALNYANPSNSIGVSMYCHEGRLTGKGAIGKKAIVDVSYAAPQVNGIVNVALHWEYPLGIVFIFSQGRKDLYHV
jgi:hypothetical protein